MQKYFDVVINTTGDAIPGALVHVLNYPSLTDAVIYSDNGVTPIVGPIATDATGAFQFYAADGRYQLDVYYNAMLVKQLADVLLFDNSAITGAASVGTANGSNVQAELDAAISGSAAVFYVSSLGPTPSTAAVQAVLLDASHKHIVFDLDWTPSGNVAVPENKHVTQLAGTTITLPDNYAVNFKQDVVTAGADLVGLFHADGARNSQFDLNGNIIIGFKGGFRASALYTRGCHDGRASLTGTVIGPWSGVHMIDSDRFHLERMTRCISDVVDTGTGPNAAVVLEGCVDCTVENVTAWQYEEAVDHNANNRNTTVRNVEANGNYDVSLRFTALPTGGTPAVGDVITESVTGATLTVKYYDASLLRLWGTKPTGPMFLGNTVTNGVWTGTLARVASAHVNWPVTITYSGSAGAAPAVGNIFKNATTGRGTLTYHDVAGQKLYVNKVTGSFLNTNPIDNTLSGGTFTATCAGNASVPFTGQNACDISNLEGGTFTGIVSRNRFKCTEMFNYPRQTQTLTMTATPAGANVILVQQLVVSGDLAVKYTVATVVGTFTVGETITDASGKTGKLRFHDTTNSIIYVTGENAGLLVSITGATSAATANISLRTKLPERLSGAYTVAETVTDQVNGGTATVISYDSIARKLVVGPITGSIATNGTLTGGTSKFVATVSNTQLAMYLNGETVSNGLGASAPVLFYDRASRKIYLGTVTGTFAVGNTVTGSVSATAGVIVLGGVSTVVNGQLYSSRFVNVPNLSLTQVTVDAHAFIDADWTGTGNFAAVPFDLKDVDDCKAVLRFTGTGTPTGTMTHVIGYKGGNRLGPATDDTYPNNEVTEIRLQARSSFACTSDVCDIVNSADFSIWPDIEMPMTAGTSAVLYTKTTVGNGERPMRARTYYPRVWQRDPDDRVALPAVTGTGINYSSLFGEHEIIGLPSYQNLATNENFATGQTTMNVVRAYPKRVYVRQFVFPSSASVSVAALGATLGTYQQNVSFPEADFGDVLSCSFSADLTNASSGTTGAGLVLATPVVRIGLGNANNVRVGVYNTTAGAITLYQGTITVVCLKITNLDGTLTS